MRKLNGAMVLVFFLSGCALFQRNRCTQNYAYNTGRAAALSGQNLPERYAGEEYCEGETKYTAPHFERDYRHAYNDAKKELCTFEQVDITAESRVNDYNFEGIAGTAFKICGADFYQKALIRYEKKFGEYLCQEDNFASYGYRDAKSWDNFDLKNLISWCVTSREELSQVYRDAYRRGQEQVCGASYMYRVGLGCDNNSELYSWLRRVRMCPNDLEPQAVASLNSGFRVAEQQREWARRRELEERRMAAQEEHYRRMENLRNERKLHRKHWRNVIGE